MRHKKIVHQTPFIIATEHTMPVLEKKYGITMPMPAQKKHGLTNHFDLIPPLVSDEFIYQLD